MLIQFDKSTRVAYGATSDHSRLDMRGGGEPRNSSIQLPGGPLSSCRTVAISRVEETRSHKLRARWPFGCQDQVAPSLVEEMTVHPFIQFLRDIAVFPAVSLFFVALGVVAAVIKALVFG